MEISIAYNVAYNLTECQSEVILLPCSEDLEIVNNEKIQSLLPYLIDNPALCDFKGKKNTLSFVYAPKDNKIQRVLLIGLGKKDKIDLDIFRTAIASAVQKINQAKLTSLIIPEFAFNDLEINSLLLLEESSYAAHLALYRFDQLKKSKDDEEGQIAIQKIIFALEDNADKQIKETAISKGQIVANAVALARNLANMPANLLAPEDMAKKALELASNPANALKCQILGVKDLEKANLNCHLAVGQGSTRPPCLIILEYNPQNNQASDSTEQNKDKQPIVLIGKGIIFDSGGLCLKPSAGMSTMKSDMSGAAIVLAVMSALAQDHCQERVLALLPCAENLPSGTAFRPGDVFYAANGDSVEIDNTDAEGRLVLCDAIAYSQIHYQPALIIDIATLTGACAVALGDGLAGLFSNNETLKDKLINAGKVAGEPLWQLPLFSKYAEKLKSEIADICHTGPREGGAINAALFLKHFVKNDLAWAHLDIAGVDWLSKATPLCPKGASAFGARLLLEFLRSNPDLSN